jgi:hypothetical protein
MLYYPKLDAPGLALLESWMEWFAFVDRADEVRMSPGGWYVALRWSEKCDRVEVRLRVQGF